MSKFSQVTKTISINQPAYLPWLGYFERIANSDEHIVLDHVQFEKNSMVNRNKILSSNSEIMLTVPVKTSGKFGQLAICDIAIENQQKWQKKHWQSIYFNYKKAAFFEKYHDSLLSIYQTTWLTLNDLLKAQLNFFIDALGIKTPIIYSSDFQWQSSKSELILEICKMTDAKRYISGALGKDYLDTYLFEQENISIEFQNFKHPTYLQLKPTFHSNLSTLDLLCNHGDKSLSILKNQSDQENK